MVTSKKFDDYIDTCVLYGTAETIIKCDLSNLLEVLLGVKTYQEIDRSVLADMAREFNAKKCIEKLV